MFRGITTSADWKWVKYVRPYRRFSMSHQSPLIDFDTINNSMEQQVIFQNSVDQMLRPKLSIATSDELVFGNGPSTASSTQHQVCAGFQIESSRIVYVTGLRAKLLARGFIFMAQHRQRRQQWCRFHRVWSYIRWKTVWFSGESRFLLHRADDAMVSLHRVWSGMR